MVEVHTTVVIKVHLIEEVFALLSRPKATIGFV
jgi:hypothetical protein